MLGKQSIHSILAGATALWAVKSDHVQVLRKFSERIRSVGILNPIGSGVGKAPLAENYARYRERRRCLGGIGERSLLSMRKSLPGGIRLAGYRRGVWPKVLASGFSS
jgi:hypothetical protein